MFSQAYSIPPHPGLRRENLGSLETRAGQEMSVGWGGSLPVDYSPCNMQAVGLRAVPLWLCGVCPDHTRFTNKRHRALGLGARVSRPVPTPALPASALTASPREACPTVRFLTHQPPGTICLSPTRRSEGALPGRPPLLTYGLSGSFNIFEKPDCIQWGRGVGKVGGLIFLARLAALGARIRPELQPNLFPAAGGSG